jgi:hypothetical protein
MYIDSEILAGARGDGAVAGRPILVAFFATEPALSAVEGVGVLNSFGGQISDQWVGHFPSASLWAIHSVDKYCWGVSNQIGKAEPHQSEGGKIKP